MKNTFSVLVVLSTLLFSDSTFSVENFVDNYYSPFPHGCATYPDWQLKFYPLSVETLVDGVILIDSVYEDSALSARIIIKRVGCADENRSVLILEVQLPDDGDESFFEIGILPVFSARINNDTYLLRPTVTPNSWLGDSTTNNILEGSNYIYTLQTRSALTTISPDPKLFLSAQQYNGAFTLLIENPSFHNYTAEIGAYHNHLQPTYMPFNGRLSGIWAVQGVEDQGFVISISEILNDYSNGLIFFSWYTFNGQGNNVWLVGNSAFPFGSGSITFEVQLVTNGQFMGSKRATRTIAGTITLTARNCNHLELQYDLSAIGLGQSIASLNRSFDLETAGYACQDWWSKAQN